MKIDAEYLLKTLFELIEIPSINPQLAKDGKGEAAIAAYTAEALKALGLETVLYEPMPGRTSALGILKGSGGGRSLMWNAHTDTVGVSGMEKPFTPELRGGRVYGRGAQDMKGSLAAMLAAVKALSEAKGKLGGDVLIAGVADEEYGSVGTADMLDRLRIANIRVDGAIVTEPTDLLVAAAHRGYAWLEVETLGRAAHGSRWWEGIDANRMMARVMVGLDELATELIRRPAHPLVGPPSLHTPVLQGGSEMSIYADHCKLQIERRTVPGETSAGVLAEIQAVLDGVARQNEDFQGSVQLWFERPAFEAGAHSELLPLLMAQRDEIVGVSAPANGVAFWTDAALIAGQGIDTLLIGPLGGGLHTTEEWVDFDSCVRLAEILADTAQVFCA